MQERAVRCRVAYRFLCCQRGPCSLTHAESSSFYAPQSDSAWCMQASFFFPDCHTNPELMLASLFRGQVLCHFELFHTKDSNDAHGRPPCLLLVTACWHHVGCGWRGLMSNSDLALSFLKAESTHNLVCFCHPHHKDSQSCCCRLTLFNVHTSLYMLAFIAFINMDTDWSFGFPVDIFLTLNEAAYLKRLHSEEIDLICPLLC